MAMNYQYASIEPPRAEIDKLEGAAVIEFGAPWCGYCKAAQPLLASAFVDYPQVPHIKIEDGKGRRLGRAFRVKLWPTIVFMRDGIEAARLVRPANADEIRNALAHIASQQ